MSLCFGYHDNHLHLPHGGIICILRKNGCVTVGATAEYLSERTGYPLDFQLVPAEDLYTGCRLWAEPEKEHLVRQMRQVFQDRERARRLGLNATQLALKSDWIEAKELRQVLRRVAMIE